MRGGSPPIQLAIPAVLLAAAPAAGVAVTAIRSDSTIAAFDAVNPSTQAFADAPVVGAAAFAARRDHKHGMPAASFSFITWLAASVNVLTDLARGGDVAFTDLDLTAATSANAKFAILVLRILTAGAPANFTTVLGVRKNGDAPAMNSGVWANGMYAGVTPRGIAFIIVGLDAGQVLEYMIGWSGTGTIDSFIDVVGYIE